MSRQVVKKSHGPFELKPQTNTKLICMCGLSKNQPFCDSSHNKTLDEDDDKIYVYTDDGKRHEICAEECCGKCCQ